MAEGSVPVAGAGGARLGNRVGYGLALGAGICWGFLGIFFRMLDGYGFDPLLIAFDRAVIAVVTLALVLAVRRPALLKVRLGDLPLFLMYGAGIGLFFWIYVKAVEAGSVALAAVLLYTAPVWIVVFAFVRWREPLGARTLGALGLALLGCVLVSSGGELRGGWVAIGLGLLSGFAYALYSLFSNEGLRRGYAPETIVLYAMGVAALGLVPFQDWGEIGRAVATPGAWPALIGVGIVSTVLAPVLYAAGQQRIGAARAAIIATVEPVVAAAVAWSVFGEALTWAQILGGGAVLAAVIVLATRKAPMLEQGGD